MRYQSLSRVLFPVCYLNHSLAAPATLASFFEVAKVWFFLQIRVQGHN